MLMLTLVQNKHSDTTVKLHCVVPRASWLPTVHVHNGVLLLCGKTARLLQDDLCWYVSLLFLMASWFLSTPPLSFAARSLGSDVWTDAEKTVFTAALGTYGKEFSLIQKTVHTSLIMPLILPHQTGLQVANNRRVFTFLGGLLVYVAGED